MTSSENVQLQHALIDPISDQREGATTFEACLNAHGMYETMRFALRLSPRNHELMELVEAGEVDPANPSPEVLQAYSTYIHETVHWWQHVGSVSGLVYSLSYLAQSHANIDELKDVLADFGPKKPLKGFTDQVLTNEGERAQAKLSAANSAVNNTLDVEYYKYYAFLPRENIKWMIEQNHFESVGHGYLIVYGQVIGMLAMCIDENNEVFPSSGGWGDEIARLREEQVEGFYWRSPVRPPAVGMRAVYEGQARFIQLQFLDGARGEPLPCDEWKERGFLSGIYVEAFAAFLNLSGSDWPPNLNSALVALFLLICDLAINPTRGIPFEVESFEGFITDVDVGVRFTRLCFAVKERPELRDAIKEYSKNDYIAVSAVLSELTGYDHPMTALQEVREWLEKAPGADKLAEEYKTFNFDPRNLPIRVFLSHFMEFSKDKFESPEFFCWPGYYMSHQHLKLESQEIWLRHLSLFSDRGDKDGIYPRKWPNRSADAVMQTFKQFYSTMALYDLTRQWILKDGPFVCDFRWLSENYNQADADAWGNDTFKQVYGVTLDEFEIVQ
ncbi:hypothetical protein HFN72_12560 [Rhizobium laguerreae]|uniref:hypothetical protein n=1 Tax=Rhizobium laguerreae TaxID=1076926 RepID=UPI001C9087E4|nr:hypothetical protein [Rhizobium laguerreae]MBY3526776.1 hypothetical protein [Rhizobium laguerreae]